MTPQTLSALAALHAAREAYAWLLDVLDAPTVGRYTPGGSGTLSARSADRRNALLRQERTERTGWARFGLTDTAAGGGVCPAPVPVELLDAQIHARLAMSELHGWLAYEVSAHRLLGWSDHWRLAWPDPWDRTTRWMLLAIHRAGQHAVEHTARLTWRVDRRLRTVLGVGPSHQGLDMLCPVCHRAGLVVETSAPRFEDRTVSCDCRCAGEGCTCDQPERVAGLPHRWPIEIALPSLLRTPVLEGAAA